MPAIRIIDDHIELANIGTNTHAQIDAHIVDPSAHHTKYTNAEAVAAVSADDKYLQNTGDLSTGKITISNGGIEDADAVGYLHLIENAASTRFSAITYSNTNWHAPFFYFLKARGTNITPLYPKSGDQLWGIFPKGWSQSTNSWQPTALIVGKASSDWSAGNYPSDIEFITYVGAQHKRLVIKTDGKIGIGTDAPTALLDVNSDILRLRTAKTPATAGAAGNTGEWCWDANYFYICVATNTWKRTAIATW